MLAAVAVAAAVSGCSGASCDELPRLRAERDSAREDFLQLGRSGAATLEESAAADDAVHELDRTVFDLEQSCSA